MVKIYINFGKENVGRKIILWLKPFQSATLCMTLSYTNNMAGKKLNAHVQFCREMSLKAHNYKTNFRNCDDME